MAQGDGKVATCYLGKQRREALDAAAAKTGWMHSHYVRIAILEKLVADGFLTQAQVDVEVEKAEHRKEHPHGNSKAARAVRTGVRTSEEVDYPSTRGARTGKATLAARREARKRNRRVTQSSKGETQ
jgi:hypothetical protein